MPKDLREVKHSSERLARAAPPPALPRVPGQGKKGKMGAPPRGDGSLALHMRGTRDGLLGSPIKALPKIWVHH